MTIVRISKGLLESVEKQITSMALASANAGYEKNHPTSNADVKKALVDAAYRKWFIAAPELRAVIPKDWLEEFERIDFKIKAGSVNLSFGVSGNYNAPHSASISFNSADVELVQRDLPPEINAVLLEYATEKTEHEAKFKKVREQVKEFLENAKSLNDAVKRFPNIALYAPKEFIDLMNAKKPEKVVEDKVVELDTSLLSTVGVMHLLGST